MKLSRGRVVLVSLDPTVGHEQRGRRPCVLVSDPAIIEDQRFPLVGVVPLTTTPGKGSLYPRITPGSSGLRTESWALLDRVRSMDKRRVSRVYGAVAPGELAAIDDGLRAFLGL